MIVPNTEIAMRKTRSVLEISTNCTAMVTNTAQSLFTSSFKGISHVRSEYKSVSSTQCIAALF